MVSAHHQVGLPLCQLDAGGGAGVEGQEVCFDPVGENHARFGHLRLAQQRGLAGNGSTTEVRSAGPAGKGLAHHENQPVCLPAHLRPADELGAFLPGRPELARQTIRHIKQAAQPAGRPCSSRHDDPAGGPALLPASQLDPVTGGDVAAYPDEQVIESQQDLLIVELHFGHADPTHFHLPFESVADYQVRFRKQEVRLHPTICTKQPLRIKMFLMNSQIPPARQEGDPSGLEWMAQNDQVDDPAFIEALVHDSFDRIYRLFLFYQKDPARALDATVRCLADAAADRHRYWGEMPFRAWIFRRAMRHGKPRKEEAETFILFLRYGLDLPASEMAAALGEKPERISACLKTLRERRLALQFLEPPLAGCRPYRDLLEAGADGPLSSEALVQLDGHLETCTRCQAYAQDLGNLVDSWKSEFQNCCPSLDLSEEMSRWLYDEISRQAAKRSSRLRISVSSREGLLVGVLLVLLVALAWSSGVMKPDSTPRRTRIIQTVMVTQLVTRQVFVVVSPTPPERLFTYRVKPGDTIESIAANFGVSPMLVASLNQLYLGVSPEPGRPLTLPGDGKPKPGYAIPTPVPSLPALEPLTIDSTVNDIRLRVAQSQNLWHTLWADVRLVQYGPPGYNGPPLQNIRKQVWISRPSNSLVVSAPGGIDSISLSYQNGRTLTMLGDNSANRYQGASTRLVDDTAIRSLFLEPFLVQNQEKGDYLVAGREMIGQIDALLLDWFNGQKGQREFRFWIDPTTGVVLRQRQYGGPDFQATLWELGVTDIAYNQNFPQDIFDPDSYWPRSFVQDFNGRAISWNDLSFYLLNEPVPGHERLARNLPPEGFDAARSRLTFQWPQTGSYSPVIELFGDGYFLLPITVGQADLPFSLPNDGLDQFLRWLAPGKAEQVLKQSSSAPQITSYFPCRRSADGNLLVFSVVTGGVGEIRSYLFWLDLTKRQYNVILPYQDFGNPFAIAPDNQRVAYGDCRSKQPCAIYVYDTKTGQGRKLLEVQSAQMLAWSPDGQSLAVVDAHFSPNQPELLVLEASTGRVIYRGPYDLGTLQAAQDAPVKDWGKAFPPPPANLEACVNPP